MGYYVKKVRIELEGLISNISQNFNVGRIDSIRQLQNALDDIEREQFSVREASRFGK